MRGQNGDVVGVVKALVILLVVVSVFQDFDSSRTPGGAASTVNGTDGLTCDQVIQQRNYYRDQTQELRKNNSDLKGNLSQCRKRAENLTVKLERLRERYGDNSVTVQYGGFDFEMKNWAFILTVFTTAGVVLLRQVFPDSWIGYDGLITINEDLLRKIHSKIKSAQYTVISKARSLLTFFT